MHKRTCCIVLVMAMVFGIQWAASAQWTWTPQTGRWVNIKRMPKETPELQIEYTRSLMLEGDYKKALRETDKFSNFYPDSDLADQNQFLVAEIREAQGKWMAAAQAYQAVVATYPGSELYDDVIAKQYEIGDRLYDQGQARVNKRWRLGRKSPYKRAIEVYSMVIDNQPFTDAAAEAQYKVGLCHHTRKEWVETAFEYRRVVEDYSTSDWVDDAMYGLANCYYDSSHPADYDQAPSRLAIDAIDNFKERFPSDERGGALDDQRAEMRERIASQRLKTAQFYNKRRNFVAARIYYEIVDQEFGDTSAAEKARQWLEDNPSRESETVARVLAGS